MGVRHGAREAAAGRRLGGDPRRGWGPDTHAYQLLTSPSHGDAQIGAIALRVGFGQGTAFSRAFRALYGMTPSAVRAAARSGRVSGGHEPGSGDASFGMLNRWLLGLDANGR